LSDFPPGFLGARVYDQQKRPNVKRDTVVSSTFWRADIAAGHRPALRSRGPPEQWGGVHKRRFWKYRSKNSWLVS